MSDKKPTFEAQLKSLESIVENLEKGDLPLEESLSQFEEGVKLTRECQKMLDTAQQKVTLLSEDGKTLEGFSVDGSHPD